MLFCISCCLREEMAFSPVNAMCAGLLKLMPRLIARDIQSLIVGKFFGCVQQMTTDQKVQTEFSQYFLTLKFSAMW